MRRRLEFFSYEIEGRSPSVLTLLDSDTQELSMFTSAKVVGETPKSVVKSFCDANGETVVVKAPLSSIKRSNFDSDRAFQECANAE